MRLLLHFSRLFLVYGIFCASAPVLAAENPFSHPESVQEKRRLLAQDFVSRLKNKMHPIQNDHGAASNVPQTSHDALETTDNANKITEIAVGTEMQFRPRVGNIMLDYDIYAIRGEDDFYLSLGDLIATLEFPITIDDEARIARGWFLREDWPFTMDFSAGTVAARGNQYRLYPDDVRNLNGEAFIASHVLGEWFDMKYKFNIGYQEMEIESAWPLPAVARIQRRNKQGGTSVWQVAEPKLPREKFDYKWLDLNAADLSLRTDYTRRADSGTTEISKRGDIYLAGNALKHDAFLIASADDRDGLTSVLGRLSRVSEDPELLGFMKARSYMVGDIDALNVPLLGSASSELGFRVSNNPLSSVSFQDTRITGRAMPGWDVELYRGATLLAAQVVDETGRYEFNDVQLYAGDNDFDVFFYGAQGEVRKESVSIPLNIAALQTQAGTYDISASLQDTQTYLNPDSDKEDKNSPHITGQYNFALGDALGYTGINIRERNGEQKFYTGAGLTTVIWQTLANINLAVDEAGEIAGRLELRRSIADWRLASSLQLQTEGYRTDDSDVPTTIYALSSLQRDFQPIVGTSTSLSFTTDYRQYADDAERRTYGISVGQGFAGVSFSNALKYEDNKSAVGIESDRVVDSLSVRTRLTKQVTARAGLDYEIRPDSYMDRYFANLQYRPTNELNFELAAQRRPEEDYSDVQLRANYTHKRFQLSPFLRYDSRDDVYAGLNVSTSLVATPDSAWPVVTSEKLSSQGMLSASVFLDVNGNSIFDEGDEPLPDVYVESVNSYRREKTDERGRVLLTRLSTTTVTDIRVDSSSLPDPFMVSINAGRSILPRAASIYEMNFPIQFSSEIDGNIYVADAGTRQTAKFTNLILLPLNPLQEPIKTRAAQDGFYLLSAIPPGQYFLTVSDVDMKDMGAMRPIPQYFNFTHKGETVYANNLVLTKGDGDIHFAVLDADALPGWQGGGAAFLRIPQEEKGGLLNLVYRLRMRDVSSGVIAGLAKFDSVDEEGNITKRYIVPGGIEDAWARCELMAREQLPCSVEVVPEVGTSAPSSAAVTQSTELTNMPNALVSVASKE